MSGKRVRTRCAYDDRGSTSAESRFWPKVDKNGPLFRGTPCWLWKGGKTAGGYGSIWECGQNRPAHKVAYEITIGPVPDGLVLDHVCRVPSCVNPAHLEPVTNRENVLRGISPLAKQALQTHCKHGHQLSGQNVYLVAGKDGTHRTCRECSRAKNRAWTARQKQKDGKA